MVVFKRDALQNTQLLAFEQHNQLWIISISVVTLGSDIKELISVEIVNFLSVPEWRSFSCVASCQRWLQLMRKVQCLMVFERRPYWQHIVLYSSLLAKKIIDNSYVIPKCFQSAVRTFASFAFNWAILNNYFRIYALMFNIIDSRCKHHVVLVRVN